MKSSIFTYHGDVETTSFFMTQIEKSLGSEGYDVIPLFFDALPNGLCLDASDKAFDKMSDSGQDFFDDESGLRKAGGAFFLTFNFAGIYSKDGCFCMPGIKDGHRDDAQLFIDAFDMKVINIIVDHPYHYHDFLYEQERLRPERYYQFCIDKKHLSYMERYFPDINTLGFLPSGGTGYADISAPGDDTVKAAADISDRNTDILFAGTYVFPEWFNVFIERNGPEYADFYRSMLDEALSDPGAGLEDIVRRRLIEEVEGGISEEEIRLTLGHIQFLDYYVRYTRRGAVIKALADDFGLHVTIAGSGWDEFVSGFDHPDRITLLEHTDSAGILKLLSDTVISLNILPSFHNGAHDRIFNSMLCGAVCATDTNPYLDSLLTDGVDSLIFQTPPVKEGKVTGEGMDSLWQFSENIKRLLDEDGLRSLGKIADAGCRLAKDHTWSCRCAEILKTLDSCL